MSNYPVWWDTTLTIYNKWTDPATHKVTWIRNTVSNSFWKHSGSKVNVGQVMIDTESIICRIPQQDNYVEPYVWIENPEMNTFTLKPSDIIIKGETLDEIDEYQTGHRSTDLIAKYHQLQGCMEIKDVTVNTMTGMINPHYLVRGI